MRAEMKCLKGKPKRRVHKNLDAKSKKIPGLSGRPKRYLDAEERNMIDARLRSRQKRRN